MSEKRDKMREAIKAADDIRRRIVLVPEWGDMEVEVRGLSTFQRADLYEKSKQGEDSVDSRVFYPTVVIASAHVPETGEALFDPEDIDWLNSKSASATGVIGTVALELSGLSKGEVDKIKKGFDAIQKKDST